MRRFLSELFSAPFRVVLVVSFSAVAAITIAIGAWVILRTVDDYLSETMTERIARDMQLADAFYSIKLREIAGVSHLLALDMTVIENLPAANQGEAASRRAIDLQITNKVSVLALGSSHFVAVLNAKGDVIAGRLVSAVGEPSPVVSGGNWAGLPIVQEALARREPMAATEVVPGEMLAQIGLADQAHIPLVETPKAAPKPFDPREGTAGLALVGVTPILDADGRVVGAAIAFHLFNRDFTLVDWIKQVAGIDSVTIFLGDLRVSTNVLTQEGERALGTRMSSDVDHVVLEQGREYTGLAFVVNQNYITRYRPLRDHANVLVGSLYVGVRQASFSWLLNAFNQRIGLIALTTILLAVVLAIPMSRSLTGPLKELMEANRQLGLGDVSVRVPVRGRGELSVLAESFNTMVETLWATRLAQAEKLASLGQLAAGVAHELNNPLGTVLLYSDTLLKESASDDPRRTDLQMIVDETQRCKGIVAALLNFARQNQVVAEPTDVNALIWDVVTVERKRDVYAKVNVVTDLDSTLPKIQADPAQLRQVFINLMTNAVGAMPQGGRLGLVTWNGPPGMVTIEVRDTGVGIPSENLPKMFTPFFTTKPIGKGTGLGLAIIYGIIKMHRGQITVQSQVGQGTTFTINLPVKLPLADANQVSTSPTIP